MRRSKAPSDSQYLFVKDIENALGIKCTKQSKENIGLWIEKYKDEYFKKVSTTKGVTRNFPMTLKQKRLIDSIQERHMELYDYYLPCYATNKKEASDWISINIKG